MRRLGRVLLNLAVLFAILCACLMVLPSILGYHRYVILTGSMTGTYDRGSIVFDKAIPVADLKVGDPITYNPPPGASPQKRVTHRVFAIGRDKQGNEVIRTKGDANKKPD